jgi:hypothetical protein
MFGRPEAGLAARNRLAWRHGNRLARLGCARHRRGGRAGPGPVALQTGTADTVYMLLVERESPLESLAEYAADARRAMGAWSWWPGRPVSASRQVARPGTLDVLVLEDVHWADEATVDLLRFLGLRLRDAAVLVIATYRDDGLTATEPPRIALGDLATQRSTQRIGLAPLSVQAVRILAGASEREAAALYQLTGGNPFYLTEVLQTGLGAVPVSARDVILARAAPLGRQARELLDVAALSGTRVELRLVGSAAPYSPAILDELLAAGLLAEDGGWLKFRHEIARLAVEQAVPAHRRAAIHARILAALVSSGCDDDARMAFHAEAAGDAAAVLRYAPRAAGRAAELASHREAAAQYERTLRFAAGGPAQAVAGLYDELARELALIDRWHDAAEAGEQALSRWRQAGDRRRGRHGVAAVPGPGVNRPGRAGADHPGTARPQYRAGLGLRQPGQQPAEHRRQRGRAGAGADGPRRRRAAW